MTASSKLCCFSLGLWGVTIMPNYSAETTLQIISKQMEKHAQAGEYEKLQAARVEWEKISSHMKRLQDADYRPAKKARHLEYHPAEADPAEGCPEDDDFDQAELDYANEQEADDPVAVAAFLGQIRSLYESGYDYSWEEIGLDDEDFSHHDFLLCRDALFELWPPVLPRATCNIHDESLGSLIREVVYYDYDCHEDMLLYLRGRAADYDDLNSCDVEIARKWLLRNYPCGSDIEYDDGDTYGSGSDGDSDDAGEWSGSERDEDAGGDPYYAEEEEWDED